MFGEMTIVRGRVRDLLHFEDTPQGRAPGTLNLDDRYVRLDDLSADYRAGLREGEELIVAGHDIVAGDDKTEMVAAYACRNVTQHHTQRASVSGDVARGLAMLVFALAAAWLSWTSYSETLLFFGLQRLGFAGLAIVLTLVSGVYFFSMLQKFRAEYLVNVAVLETIRGAAQKVEQILRAEPERHVPRFAIAGRPVRFAVSRVLNIHEGDNVVVAGQPASDGFVGLALRNVTHSVSERSWDRWSRFETVMIFLLGIVLPAWMFSGSPDEFTFMMALRYVAIFAIWSMATVGLVRRFYAWKLDQEARRRVRE